MDQPAFLFLSRNEGPQRHAVDLGVRGRGAGQLLPLTWFGFAFMPASGLALFASEAVRLAGNAAFQVKLVLLVLAGLNPLIFHVTVYRHVATWGKAPVISSKAKIAAVVSPILWSGIIICGRMIAYFH